MIADTIQRVRDALANGEKPAALARKAGLHPNTLYGADTDGWNPKASTLLALERLLDAESDTSPAGPASTGKADDFTGGEVAA